MKTSVTFLDCPAYLDEQAETRCGLPAEVECRYTVESSSGPLESAKIRCPRGHWFNGPVECLTWGHSVQPANRFGLPAFYSLHAWAWKHNPAGRFSIWNPKLTCPPE